jgi:hypothetical protein
MFLTLYTWYRLVDEVILMWPEIYRLRNDYEDSCDSGDFVGAH